MGRLKRVDLNTKGRYGMSNKGKRLVKWGETRGGPIWTGPGISRGMMLNQSSKYGVDTESEKGKIEDHRATLPQDRPNSLPYYPRLWSSGTGVLSRDSTLSQKGTGLFRHISETTDEERQHVDGTINLLPSNLKMRFLAPGDWIRIKFDLLALVRHVCGEPFLGSRRQAGESLRKV